MKLHFFHDPGHGWLKVPIKLLKKLGIENDISSYSYIRSEYAYLEEDTDVSLFYTTMKKANKPFDIIESHTNNQSKIRNYDSYQNYTTEELSQINNLREKMLHSNIWSKKAIKKISIASLNTLKHWQTKYKL